MPRVLSNQLKALLVLDDITDEGVSVWQNNCFTVQHFSYQCNRQRNEAGVPYGPTLPSYLDFTVRVSENDSAKLLFERIGISKTFPYSFLFNASFSTQRRLSDCEDGMVAQGYLVELDESYDSAANNGGTQEQMLIRGRLLLSHIRYVGRENSLKLNITND